ncbi:MAG: PRC-barrel domain-containing protein [Clostridiales bacterium]|nr:PRC-barrel domain-containing protein [Clostridiales bacterium]
MNAAKLNGKQVITSKAEVLGEVEGVEINTSDWSVTHIQISLLKQNIEKFNYKKPLFGSISVCIPVTLITAISDVVSISKSIEDLKYMKEFKIQE